MSIMVLTKDLEFFVKLNKVMKSNTTHWNCCKKMNYEIKKKGECIYK